MQKKLGYVLFQNLVTLGTTRRVSERERERERERETCKIAEKIKLLERDKIVSKNYCDNKRRTAAERNLVHST